MYPSHLMLERRGHRRQQTLKPQSASLRIRESRAAIDARVVQKIIAGIHGATPFVAETSLDAAFDRRSVAGRRIGAGISSDCSALAMRGGLGSVRTTPERTWINPVRVQFQHAFVKLQRVRSQRIQANEIADVFPCFLHVP